MFVVLEKTEDYYNHRAVFSSEVEVTIELIGVYKTKEEADEIVKYNPERRITLTESESITLFYGHSV